MSTRERWILAMQGDVTPGDAPGYPITISQSGSDVLTSNLVVRGTDFKLDHIRVYNHAGKSWLSRSLFRDGGSDITNNDVLDCSMLNGVKLCP